MAQAVKSGLHDRIVEFTRSHIDAVADVGSRSEIEIPMPSPEEMNMMEAMLPAGLEIDDFMDQGKFPIMQLRKRLKGAGISDDALAALEEQWWARRERNFDDYEEMFGKPHPIRLRLERRRAAHS